VYDKSPRIFGGPVKDSDASRRCFLSFSHG
jgi:hypothetical protein